VAVGRSCVVDVRVFDGKEDGWEEEAFNSRGLPWNDCASLNPVKRVREARRILRRGWKN
jgi:hypothetical protein